MMRLILVFCLSVICSSYNTPKLGQRILFNYEGSNKETDKSIFYYTEKEELKNAGFDERYNKIDSKELEQELINAKKNYEIMKLLKKLENPLLGENDKLLLIESNKFLFLDLDNTAINILKGDLLTDWEFNFGD